MSAQDRLILANFPEAHQQAVDALMGELVETKEQIRTRTADLAAARACQNIESDPMHEGEASPYEFLFYGLKVRINLCEACARWVEKFYREDRATARYGK